MIIRDAWGQGTGRHTKDQVETRLCGALDAISEQLGEGPYFLGDQPRTIDATVHAFLWALLDAPFESRAREHAHSLQNFRAYCDRMNTKYFSTAAATKSPDGLRVVGNAA